MRWWLLVLLAIICSLPSCAQYNMKKMMEEGRRQLDAGYYVASMQIFMRVVALKPNLFEAWYLSALSKYHLDDFKGAEEDCSRAIVLNPYIADIFDLRGMSRIALAEYDSAAVDYTLAASIDSRNRNYWYNCAYSIYMSGNSRRATQLIDSMLTVWPGFDAALRLRRQIRRSPLPKNEAKGAEEVHFNLGSLASSAWLNRRMDLLDDEEQKKTPLKMNPNHTLYK